MTVLIVPGFRGSGAEHWQSWFESQLPCANRVSGIDWDTPVLTRWAEVISREIAQAAGPVWLVAHSFGCLASIKAAVNNTSKVVGALLVAPADPGRFTAFGHITQKQNSSGFDDSITPLIPQQALRYPSLLVASSNDPWMALPVTLQWAHRWNSRLINLGDAGHINEESGYGPWEQGLNFLYSLRMLSRGWAPRSFACGEK